jgi:hypothetical protein
MCEGDPKLHASRNNLGCALTLATIQTARKKLHGLATRQWGRTLLWSHDGGACVRLSLLKKVFDLGIERPMVGIGNSSLGEYGLDRGRGLAIKLGFGAVLQSEGTVVKGNNRRHRTRPSCTATTRG